ncbi:hypothetical protein INP83_17400 [Mucilaginibacter sp. 21P]|uniref:hypothetical protein n=1 Tax=Mucilaginibacter sp. 21P TaxID=2778902 RepID=UPI001C57CB61|nr:hypothetical protein [Mucilaginibacter sp. 21P]QXV64842.1 hypothetical protein INP83_17400 [Mucilaginibacter sp. 21P]
MSSEPGILKSMNIEVAGYTYTVNSSDIADFLTACEAFMAIRGNEFEIMTQTITDTIIDNCSDKLTMESLRPQLKFLREVGYLLNGFVSNMGE